MGNIATELLITAKEELDKKINYIETLKQSGELLTTNSIERKFKPNLLTYLR